MSALFAAVEMAPRDPILGLNEQFNADPNPNKVNLGVGVYYDENGKLPLLKCVAAAEKMLLEAPKARGYLPIDGIPAYDKAVQTLVFGYAVTTDVTHIPTAIFDLDNSRASRELTARFTGSSYFDVVAYVDWEEEVRHLLDRGLVKAVLRMNKGFGDDLRAGRTAPLQMIVDGTDSNTAGIVLNWPCRSSRRLARAIRTSAPGPVASTISSGVSRRRTPLYSSPSMVAAIQGS